MKDNIFGETFSSMLFFGAVVMIGILVVVVYCSIRNVVDGELRKLKGWKKAQRIGEYILAPLILVWYILGALVVVSGTAEFLEPWLIGFAGLLIPVGIVDWIKYKAESSENDANECFQGTQGIVVEDLSDND